MNLTPCDTCPAPCCRKYSVDITLLDAYRIATTLNLSMADFTELLWTEHPDESRRIVLGPNGRFWRFRLKKVEDRNEAADADARCVFLHELTEGRAICSIYGFRPEICRTYPSYLEGGVLSTSGGKYCPEGAFSIERMDVRPLRADWMLRRRFDRAHHLLIDGWNERLFFTGSTMTEGDLHGFITNACRELEAIEPALFVRPAPGSPFLDPYDDERLAGLTDRVLRSIGWRTDETLACSRPGLGRSLPMADSGFYIEQDAPEIVPAEADG